MAVSIQLGPDELLDQAAMLERRAESLRSEAGDLLGEARRLRVQHDRMTRKPVEVLHPDAMKLKGTVAQKRMASQILNTLETLGPCASSVIGEHIGVSAQRAGAELRKLRELSLVVQSGMKRGSLWALPSEDFAAVPHDRSDYRHLIRDAAQNLGTFTLADIDAELPMVSDQTVRRHLAALVNDGVLVVERVGRTYLYGFVRAGGVTPARPRRATPESEAARTFARGGNGQVTSGRRLRTGNKRSDELLTAARRQGAKVLGFTGRNHAIVELNGERTRVSMTPGGAGNANRDRLRSIGVDV